MKPLVVVAVLIFSTLSLNCASAVRTESAGPSNVLDAFHEAAHQIDAKRYLSLLAKDAVFIGTDATERWSRQVFSAYVNKHFSAGKGWTMRVGKRFLTRSPKGDIVWFHERLEHAKYGALRGSGVLLRTRTGWKISQYVLSFPIPNKHAKAVLRVMNAPDRS